MITVTYQLYYDEPERKAQAEPVVKEFKDHTERMRWELKQLDHPFMHYKTISIKE